MKKSIFILALATIFLGLQAQEKEEIKLYDPDLDGMEQIDKAVEAASASGKHVFVQVGGNWCGWCILFDKFVKEDAELQNLINDNYEVIHLNWSRENKNEESMERLGFPGRFGYPVFVILDGKGQRIHTQNSALLEEGKGYNRKDVINFFKSWTAEAVDPASYKD